MLDFAQSTAMSVVMVANVLVPSWAHTLLISLFEIQNEVRAYVLLWSKFTLSTATILYPDGTLMGVLI